MKTLGTCVIASLLVLAAAHADDAPSVVVRPIASATQTASGQPIKLPQGKVRVSMSEFTIAPGATLPVHKHPFPRFGYVLEGTLSVTDQDIGQTFVYKGGDMIVEVVDEWHSGTNIGQIPVRLLVIDEVEGDGPNTILK